MKTVSERNLYNIVKERFPDAEFQKKFDWLGQLSLDVYIPSKKTAIEYQGEQHFRPVEAFGGKSAYKRQVMNDKRKIKRCKEYGINLLYFTFDTNEKTDKLHGKKVFKNSILLFKEIRFGKFVRILKKSIISLLIFFFLYLLFSLDFVTFS